MEKFTLLVTFNDSWHLLIAGERTAAGILCITRDRLGGGGRIRPPSVFRE